MSTFEYNVIRAVQTVDNILVAVLPWLRWLAVAVYSACAWALGKWKPP